MDSRTNFEEIDVYLREPSSEEFQCMRQNFEAGGTQLWGVDFEVESDSEMTNLTTIKENEEALEIMSDHGSHLETNSYTDSINASMKRRQSELRSDMLRHKRLWQKAAQQVKQGASTTNRRKSILEDIGLTDFNLKPSIDLSVDEEESENSSKDVIVEDIEAKETPAPVTQPSSPPIHNQVLPLSSSDIEKNVKPQLRPDRKIWGFLFPRMPTQFTTELNESLYQRYYSHKRKKTMIVVNILYSLLIVGLYVLKILPIPKQTIDVDIEYMLRETLIAVSMLLLHIGAIICVKKANSCQEVLACAYATWVLLLLHTQITPITSFVDYRSADVESMNSWDSFGTWQTAVSVIAPFGFLSVIPLRRMLLLSLILIILHTVSTGILTGLYDVSCLLRILVDALILIALTVMGMFNYYLVERTERKAFLEIRTCIASRHTIAKENQSQERLVLSVLPKFIVNDILKEECQSSPFYNVYLRRYENVSILFADICGFTTLGTKLAPKDLVNMLNDLFANFDKLAKKHKCIRIKLLGDCYEAVSGIPEHTADHADNCVEMGLDMIGAIRLVREQQKVQCLDMRIGVHTGSVFGGVLGLRKWQFDVYSDDVTTANVMEASGEKGRVHISEATKLSLTRPFEMVPNVGLSNAYLNKLGMSTYFIVPSLETNVEVLNNNKKKVSYDRRHTVHSIDGEYMPRELETKMPVQLRHSTDNAVNNMLERATDSKADDKIAKEHLQWISLTYKDKENERKYRNRKDEAFQVNTLSFLIMVAVTVITQIVSNSSAQRDLYWLSPLLTGVVFTISAALLICVLIYRHIIYYKYQQMLKRPNGEWQGDKSMINRLKELKNSTIPANYWLRNVLMTVAVLALFFSTVFQPLHNFSDEIQKTDDCYNAYLCLAWLLVLFSTASFLNWLYPAKLIMILLMFVVSICVFERQADRNIFDTYTFLSSGAYLNGTAKPADHTLYTHVMWYARVEYIIMITFSSIVLIYYSMMLEKHARLDFLWRVQAKQELEEMDSVRGNNLTLLRNILPEHVANNFLARNRKDEELYCESYNNVAVMFASICNFNEFWLAVQANGHGYGCLMILNEIIADFDELLTQPAFVEVEKIKTIGSTYMTCVGLSPVQKSENNVTQNLKTSIDLAFEMQKALAVINQNSFNNDFKIRIGINHGPLVAGVIGARKPHYDIWGHTVNIASRMESNCAAGEILVMESTANIMNKKLHYNTRYKDTINVKGLATPQKVYTVSEPNKLNNPPSMRRASLTVSSTAMNSFDSVVLKLLKSPSTRQKVKEAVNNTTE